MNLIQYKKVIEDAFDALKVQSKYASVSSAPGSPSYYDHTGLDDLRRAVLSLVGVPGVRTEVFQLMNSWSFSTKGDNLKLDSAEDTKIKSFVETLKAKLKVILELIEIEESELKDIQNTLAIHIPEMKGFQDLQKNADDLHKAIEFAVIDNRIGGKVEIVSGGHGSVILFVFLGVSAAVSLVAHICLSAAAVRIKNSEARMFESQAKEMEMKDEVLRSIADTIILQQKKVLHSEAEAILSKHYNSEDDPELLERLKLSVSSMALLMDKGVKVLPASPKDSANNPGLTFPDYNLLNVASSPTKKLEEGGE